MHEPDLALLMNAAIIDIYYSMVKYAWSDLRKFTQQIPATQANGASIDPSYGYMQRSSGGYTLRSVHCINSTNSEWSDVERNNITVIMEYRVIFAYMCIPLQALVIHRPSVNGCFWFTSRGYVMPFPQTLAQRYVLSSPL